MRRTGIWVAGVAVAVALFGACGGSTDILGAGGADSGPSYDHCSANADCVIRAASCCGQCGAATRSDVVALAKDSVAAHQAAVCGETHGCPACYMAQDATLIATCQGGHCAVVDLLLHESTACAQDGDCRIRTNVCCECGGPTDREHLIAVSVEWSFSSLVCDGQGCPECAPQYPPEFQPRCSGGHCIAVGPPF